MAIIRIDDDNWRDLLPENGIIKRTILYGSPAARAAGMVPIEDTLDVLIPWDDMEERITEANRRRQMPIHYLEAANHAPHSQGRTNYCWAYGITLCIEVLRLMENQPYRRLGPASLGWLVSWRNRGNYLASAIQGVWERGVASAEFVKDGTTNHRTFKEGWEADALKHKLHEWTDTDSSDPEYMAQQCASLLVGGLPLYEAFNWWSHALARVGVVWDPHERYNLRWIDWNSHSDGRIEMTGLRGIPDEAYAPRVSTVSV